MYRITDRIRIGDHIDIVAGELVVRDYNGDIVYVDEYEISLADELVLVKERVYYTLSEIGHAMREVDGKIHNVVFVKYEDEDDE